MINLFHNGDFAKTSWRRRLDPAAPVECEVWRQTFAAARWKVRYARAEGGAITQRMAPDGSLELSGAASVTQSVFFGQRVLSGEATRYRKQLMFSARILMTPSCRSPIRLLVGTPKRPDIFGDAFNDETVTQFEATLDCRETNQWQTLSVPVDARGFEGNGLSVELEFSVGLLDAAEKAVRISTMELLAQPEPAELPASAGVDDRRNEFFQRHDSTTVNSIGRALVVNQHELHFQFCFPHMRAFPDCTLPRTDKDLCVFTLDGIPQSGFCYDVTYRSRGSVIIRATKPAHGLVDGFLSFVGNGAAILLDAEP